jgi:plastocyanin
MKEVEKMNSKLLIIVIITLIVALGAFTFLGNKKTNPTTSTRQPEPIKSQQTTSAETETNKQVTNVILGGSSFVPKDIAVKAGARVVWINKSGKAATVNSDDHPTHRLYPFLNLGEFANATTVQVVVEKPGKYSYHNHLNPSETGTITVE